MTGTLLLIPDVATELGVSATVVRRLIERRELVPASEVWRGKQRIRLFRPDEVSALKRKRAGGSEQES